MILADIRTRVLERIEVDPADAAWQFAANSAINEGQRIFVFLTLCLESTADFALTPGTAFYNMLAKWADWIVPLRVRISTDAATGTGAEYNVVQGNAATFNEQAAAVITTATPKLRAETLYQMAAQDPAWLNATGTPTRYGMSGWDLLYLNRNPDQDGLKLLITYARTCAELLEDGDIPEIPAEDHEALINYGIARLRANEGGMELANASALLAAYLATAKARADRVRLRSLAAGYDTQPPELKRRDLSRKVK